MENSKSNIQIYWDFLYKLATDNAQQNCFWFHSKIESGAATISPALSNKNFVFQKVWKHTCWDLWDKSAQTMHKKALGFVWKFNTGGAKEMDFSKTIVWPDRPE